MLTLSRPRHWVFTFGPFMIGYMAGIVFHGLPGSVAAGFSASEIYFSYALELINPSGALLLAFYFLYPANLLIYGIHDIFRYRTDITRRRKDSYERTVNLVEHTQIRKHILLRHVFILGLIAVRLAVFPPSQGWLASFMAAFVLFWFFAMYYNAPPIQAKNIPFVDGLFQTMFVIPGVIGYLLTSGADVRVSIVPILGAICFVVGLYTFGRTQTIKKDRIDKLHTTATYLGKHRALLYSAVMFFLAALFTTHVLEIFSILASLVYIGFIFVAFVKKNIDGLYDVIPQVNFILGLLLLVWLVWLGG